MRKNKFMRAASGLLVAVLLTTCVISGTFAKYTTSATGSDSARVATWGFDKKNASVTLTDLFKNTYSNVTGANSEDVIAPGTTGEGSFQFKYEGQESAPEVAYTFKVSTDGSSCDSDIQNNKNIIWYLDGKKAPAVTGAEEGSWTALLAAIESLDGTDGENGTTYSAGQLPTKFDVKSGHSVKWEWVYHTDDNADTTDTDMGNATKLANVKLNISITAEQID